MEKRRVIAAQNVTPELWEKVQAFLQAHKRIATTSTLSKVAIETFIDMANQYGLDSNWQIKLPQNAKEQEAKTQEGQEIR